MLTVSPKLVEIQLQLDFPVTQMEKNLPAMQETQVQSLGWEDPLEKGMATHSCVLAWRIPWTKDKTAGRSPWGYKESDTTERLHSLSCDVWDPSASTRDQTRAPPQWKQSPNHQTARQVPSPALFFLICISHVLFSAVTEFLVTFFF